MKILEWTAIAALAAGICLLGAMTARTEEATTSCPVGAKSCKVITITPDEEQALAGPNMIFDHAEWANRATLGQIVQAWRLKVLLAPQGKVVPAPAEKK